MKQTQQQSEKLHTSEEKVVNYGYSETQNKPEPGYKMPEFTKTNIEDFYEDFKKNDKIYTNTPVENSPFRICGTPDKGYVIILGHSAVSLVLKSEQDALKYISEKPWDLILTTVTAYLREIEEHEQERQETNASE